MLTVNNNALPVPAVPNHSGVSPTPARILAEPADGGLTLKELWRRLMRQKALFLTTLLLTLLLSALITWSLTPQFRAVSTLQIEKQGAQIVDFGELNKPTPDMGELDPFFRTQYEQLKSRELAQRIINKLDLEQRLFDRNFGSPLKVSIIDRFQHMFKLVLDWAKGLAFWDKKAQSVDIDPVDKFLKNLYVEPVEKTHLVKVFYETPDPELSAEIVNTLVKTFINETLTADSQTDTYAQTFLELELEKARDRLTSSEDELVQYARDNGILEVNNSQEAQEKKLTELNSALALAEQRKTEADSQLSEGQFNGNAADVLRNPVIEGLKRQLSDLEAEYQNLSKIFKPAYPDMQQLAREIETVRRKLAAETVTVKNTATATLEAESVAATSLVERLQDELADYKDQLLDLRDRSVEYNALQRELDTNRKLYEGLLQRNQEVGVAAGASSSNIRIIDPAKAPVKHFRPVRPLNMLIGLIAGLLLASALALLRESLNNSLASTEELEKLSGLPILGTIPYVSRLNQRKLPLAALRDIGSSASEAYRIAAANLKFVFPEPGSRIFLVTSVDPAVGKSTSAVNLALSKSQIGNKVLLIDADFRRPTIHHKMELNNHLGLSEYLHGDIELSKVTQHFAEAKNTYVITAGLLNLDPVEALSCDRMLKLIEMARQYFDVTIIDAPPVTGFADALLLAEQSDATIIVTHAENIDRQQMSQALARLQRVKQNVAGFLVVKSRDAEVPEGYYQRYQQQPVSSVAPLASARHKTDGLNLAR
ncbi:MAG: GumC family protein [Thiolinea sp.]